MPASPSTLFVHEAHALRVVKINQKEGFITAYKTDIDNRVKKIDGLLKIIDGTNESIYLQ